MKPARNATPWVAADSIACGASPPASRSGIASTRFVTRSFSLISRKKSEFFSNSAARCGAACWRLLIALGDVVDDLVADEPDRTQQHYRRQHNRERARDEAEVREPGDAGIHERGDGHCRERPGDDALRVVRDLEEQEREPEGEHERERGANRQPHPECARHVDHRLVRYRRGDAPLGPSTDDDPRDGCPRRRIVVSTSTLVPRSRSRSRSRCSRSRCGSSARSRGHCPRSRSRRCSRFALNPLVEALKRRTGWNRRAAAGVVLVTAADHRRESLAAVDHRADHSRGPRLQQADPADGEGSRHAPDHRAPAPRGQRVGEGAAVARRRAEAPERELEADRERGGRDRRRHRGRAVHDPARDHDGARR